MKKGFVFLLLILFVPTLIVGFLYLFGKNNYSAQNARYEGVTLSGIGNLQEQLGQQTGVVMLFPQPISEQDCQFLDRVLYRLGAVQKEAPLSFVAVGRGGLALQQACPGISPEHYPFVKSLPAQDTLAYTALAKHLALRTDSGDLSRTTILTDGTGHVINIYDLKRETLLDTLVTEALIIVESEK